MSTVVVTGASAGVGRATARAFARRGASVALLARDREGLQGAATDVSADGGTPLIVPLDIADSDAVERAADTIERRLGPIDVWVNNAVVSVFSPVHELAPAEVQRVTDVAYMGTVHGTLSALRRMRPRDRGTIVQVSSALAYRSIPLQAAYCGAKHAVEGFTDSLRCELLHDHSSVHVTTVQLPALNTPQFEWVKTRLPRHPQPVAPIYQPEVAAAGIVWAAEHTPRSLKVGMPTLLAIYGNRVAPGMLDRYLARTGYDSQQLDEQVDSSRPDNLFTPVAGKHRSHGRFDQRAHTRSRQLQVRSWVAGVLRTRWTRTSI